MPPSPVAKTWDFTLNNYTENDLEWVKMLGDQINSGLVCKEVGDLNGTPHLQGRVTFKRAYRLAALKKINSRIHWGATLRTEDELYCMKEDAPENVVLSVKNTQQGKRNDIEDVRQMVADGVPNYEIVQRVNSLQALRSVGLIREMMARPRPITVLDVTWIYGPTGTNKTGRVYEECPDVYKPLSEKWWCGYEGQQTVLFDEVRGDWCTYDRMLTLLDRYPLKVETKGGFREAQYTKVYITSCSAPQDVWRCFGEDSVQQLLRRITRVIYTG